MSPEVNVLLSELAKMATPQSRAEQVDAMSTAHAVTHAAQQNPPPRIDFLRLARIRYGWNTAEFEEWAQSRTWSR